MEKAHFREIRATIIQELKEANTSIKVAVAWFTNHDLFDVLCSKLQDGVSIDLIIINDFINNRYGGLDFQKFIKLGGKFYFAKTEVPMHNKFCLIDNLTVITGSYNWTYFAESINHENIVILKHNKSLFEQFENEFIKIKHSLDLEEIVIPLNIETLDIYDTFSAKQYLSKDYYQFAISEQIKGNDQFALTLVNKSLEFDAKNSYLIKASEEIAKNLRIKSEKEVLEKKLNEEKKQITENIENEERVRKAALQREQLKIEQEKREEQVRIQHQGFQLKLLLESVEKWKKKGDLEYHQKQYDNALISYEKAVELKKDYPEAYLGISYVFWRKNEYEKTIYFANKAIQYNIKKLELAYNIIGMAYSGGKYNYKKAIEYYDKAIELDPLCYVYYWNKGITYNSMEDKISENSSYLKTIELCSEGILTEVKEDKKIRLYAVRGDAKKETGDKQGAKSDYTKAKILYDAASLENKDLHDFDRISQGLEACNT